MLSLAEIHSSLFFVPSLSLCHKKMMVALVYILVLIYLSRYLDQETAK